MQRHTIVLTLMALLTATTVASAAIADVLGRPRTQPQRSTSWLAALFSHEGAQAKAKVELGPRPAHLIAALAPSALKWELESCADESFEASDFSIGHQAEAAQLPEHTRESYLAAARAGAGIVACDVTFTRDRQLVCRASQCDLHTTTNILAVPELAAKCTEPFVASDPGEGRPASALCCTSDVTLAEFKTLHGKADRFDPRARTVEEYMGGHDDGLDVEAVRGTLLSHRESIALIDELGLKFTPQLTAPSVPMPFQGDYTQQRYARQLVSEYQALGIAPRRVLLRSFRLDDVLYWVRNTPLFGRQAVFLDQRVDTPEGHARAVAGMGELARQGVRMVAPPAFALLTLDREGRMVPSDYARAARAHGLGILTWTLEHSGSLRDGGGYYYQSVAPAIDDEGDMLTALDVLAMQVGVLGVFSDGPSAITYYANCMDL